MRYPRVPDYRSLSESLVLHAALKAEYGAKGIKPILEEAEKALRTALARVKALPVDPALRSREPDDLPAIRRLRPRGPRVLWHAFDADRYREKLGGALLARMAGCTLGAIVEGWSVERMKTWTTTSPTRCSAC
jgi:hypothetical protein